MNILVVDDHPIFIDGISHVLNELAESTCIVKAATGKSAIDALSTNIEFDLILLDLNLPDLNGVSLLHRFEMNQLFVPIVVISSEEQIGLIKETLDWGVMGFIPKSYSAEKIRFAIRSVLDGQLYIPHSIKHLLNIASLKSHDESLALQSGISHKQFEVLVLLSKGHSNEQIALLMNRTEHTVKSHIAALFQILGASNRMECVKIAQKRGLIKPD